MMILGLAMFFKNIIMNASEAEINSNMKPLFALGRKKMNSHISHKVRVQFLDTLIGYFCLHSCPALRKKKNAYNTKTST